MQETVGVKWKRAFCAFRWRKWQGNYYARKLKGSKEVLLLSCIFITVWRLTFGNKDKNSFMTLSANVTAVSKQAGWGGYQNILKYRSSISCPSDSLEVQCKSWFVILCFHITCISMEYLTRIACFSILLFMLLNSYVVILHEWDMWWFMTFIAILH